MLTVDPRYFKTIGLPLQRGRDLTDEDGMTGRESAIVNQRFAALHFPNEDPIGRRITLSIDLQGGPAPAGGIPVSLTATIVGIVPNLRQRDFQLPDPDPIAYLPFRTDPRGFMNLLVRSSGDPERDDADPARGSPRDRSGPAAVRHPHDGRGAGTGAMAVPHLRLDVRDLRVHRARPVGGRTLCRDGICRVAAHAGDRRAHGARRAGQRGGVAVPAAVVRAARRSASRSGVAGAFGVGTLFASTQLLVQNRAGDPITIGGIALLLADRRQHRVLPAGAPRDAARSADRAAARLGPQKSSQGHRRHRLRRSSNAKSAQTLARRPRRHRPSGRPRSSSRRSLSRSPPRNSVPSHSSRAARRESAAGNRRRGTTRRCESRRSSQQLSRGTDQSSDTDHTPAIDPGSHRTPACSPAAITIAPAVAKALDDGGQCRFVFRILRAEAEIDDVRR